MSAIKNNEYSKQLKKTQSSTDRKPKQWEDSVL